jgi:hypothetical protein
MAKLSKSLIRLTGELERYQGSGSRRFRLPRKARRRGA